MCLATPLQAGCAVIVNTKVVIFVVIGQPFADVFFEEKRTRSEDVLHFCRRMIEDRSEKQIYTGRCCRGKSVDANSLE